MSLNVEIVTTPGLYDMLQDEIPPAELVDHAIDDFQSTPWLRGTNLADDLDKALEETDEGPRAVWEAVRGRLLNEKRTVVAEDWQNVTVGVLWLQLPDVAGAKSTLTIAESTGNELAATCNLPGIGGGIRTSFKITGKVEHSAASTERCELSVQAKFQKIEITRGNKVIGNNVQLVEWGAKTIDFIGDTPPAPPTGVVPVPSYWNPHKSPGDVTVEETVSRVSSGRAVPVPSRIAVRSIITVTYVSPRRVWRQTCSSTPMTLTASNRAAPSISMRLPSARTASSAVCQATPRPSATRATVRWPATTASSAHRSPRRDNLARGSAARVVSWRHTCPRPVQR